MVTAKISFKGGGIGASSQDWECSSEEFCMVWKIFCTWERIGLGIADEVPSWDGAEPPGLAGRGEIHMLEVVVVLWIAVFVLQNLKF